MNVYSITTDGTSKLYKAKNLAGAVAIDEEAYITECRQESIAATGEYSAFTEREDREDYQKILLESVTLIGELENP